MNKKKIINNNKKKNKIIIHGKRNLPKKQDKR